MTSILCQAQRSADRVKTSITKFIENRLRLKVNEKKSAIGRPWESDFRGYSFTAEKQTRLSDQSRVSSGFERKSGKVPARKRTKPVQIYSRRPKIHLARVDKLLQPEWDKKI